jgi:hypothetical protein
MDVSPALSREQIDALATQIAELSFRIDTAKHALLTHLRNFDIHEGWANTGFLSTAAWLSWRIDIGPVAAREYVRVARALGELKLVDAVFASGKLSYSKVRAITRSATLETEQDFLDIAPHATASQIEKLSAAYRRVRIDPDQPSQEGRRFVRRSETASGMIRIEAQLPPEQANILWEAINAALDADRETPKDASAEARRQPDPTTLQTERADALVSVAQGYLQHSPPTLGSGYELVLMTTKEQLEHGPGGVGGFLRDGTPVPHHLARMLACDCTRVDVEISETGDILDVGRARRTIPSAIGRALWLRDGGCRVPGCGRKRHVQAHHIEAWAAGGKTSQSNLVLLCPSHHTLVHEGKLAVEVRDNKIEFRTAQGLKIEPAPDRGADLEALDHWLRTAEPEFDRNGTPRWDGSRFDLDEVLTSMLVAERSRATAGSRARACPPATA